MSNFARKIQRARERERKIKDGGWGDIIVHGAGCLWWDSGSKAGRTVPFNGHSFPCCPHCGSLLMQVENEASFFKGVDEHEANGHPGYRAMLLWIRGKCFKTVGEAMVAWKSATAAPEGESDATTPANIVLPKD